MIEFRTKFLVKEAISLYLEYMINKGWELETITYMGKFERQDIKRKENIPYHPNPEDHVLIVLKREVTTLNYSKWDHGLYLDDFKKEDKLIESIRSSNEMKDTKFY